MLKIKFATPETIIQPVGGLVVEKPHDEDHILGVSGPDWERLHPGGHWTDLISPEIQKNRFGDTYMCSSFSLCSALEFVHKKRTGEEINLSDIFVGKGSGTERNVGNSQRAPAEFVRTKGFLYETEYPYTPDTTLDQVYSDLSPNLLSVASARLQDFDTGYKLLAGNSAARIKDGLEFSPVREGVEGIYEFNGKGFVANAGNAYAHEVIIFDYEPNVCWHIWDSESQQYVKFDWNYSFSSPMIHNIIKKKTTNMQLIKEISSPAVYLFSPASGVYFGIADGSGITGGDLLKTFSGTYGNAGIKKVPDGSIPKDKIVGDIKADLFPAVASVDSGNWFANLLSSFK